EGFRVDTPNSRVIDRGTRFVVNVSEFSETEVQVVEGAADIYPESEEAKKVHLTDGSGRRVGNKGLVPVNFSADSYRRQVPDRIISFEATRGADGKARELSQVTVQRDGLIREYQAGDLIPIELLSFTPDSSSPSLNVFGDKNLPERRATLIEDMLLNGGIINPGGSARPLQQEFDYRTTPGFAIRFARPVRNGPGPDVVFFEVQNPMNPSDGDAFHVGPLEREPGKRFHTVRRYDLMMTSAEALLITERYIHYADHQIRSPEDLETAAYSAKISPLNTRALAVGIDLSDLGYEDGESTSGLFFQDAKDDDNHVDPIVIRGLPH
ncbi:MAG: FecR family protein, partial [Verrucomicrobiales bacterium]|nr:FecR family protein [Verrucomicrobiales bacterium]